MLIAHELERRTLVPVFDRQTEAGMMPARVERGSARIQLRRMNCTPRGKTAKRGVRCGSHAGWEQARKAGATGPAGGTRLLGISLNVNTDLGERER